MLIITRSFKKTLSVLILILHISFASASYLDVVSDTGTVTLIIQNRPPVIKSIQFNPEITFEDTKLECIPSINDENPEEVKFIYRWYINNALVEASGNSLEGFEANNVIRCEITPIDSDNAVGETKSASTIVNKKSALSVVTGFLVKNYDANILAILNFLSDIL